MVNATVKLRRLLVDAAVDPAVWAEKRSGEGELVATEARQFGGFGRIAVFTAEKSSTC